MKRTIVVILLGTIAVSSCVSSQEVAFIKVKNCVLDSLYDFQIGSRSLTHYYVKHLDNTYYVGVSTKEDTLSLITKWSEDKGCCDTLKRTDGQVKDIEKACVMLRDIFNSSPNITSVSLRINKSGDVFINLYWTPTEDRYSILVTNNGVESALDGFQYQFDEHYFNEEYLYGRKYDRINESLYYRIDP